MPKNDHDDAEDIEYLSVKDEPKESEAEAPPQGSAGPEAKKEQKEEKPESEEIKSLKNKLRKRDSELKLLKKEEDELKDKDLRLLAEMENMRKRLEREKSEYFQFALGDLMRELLAVLDNLGRALEAKDETDGKTLRNGIELIHKQLLDLLLKNGVSRLDVLNCKFDPASHQALMTEESEEVEEPMVVEELQKGYLLHNRLLRPSLVKVRVPKRR
jgi:molecular chaperone GrpE